MTGRSFDLWTNLIFLHFFKPSGSGQRVRLNVTGELLDALGGPHGLSSRQFLSQARRGLSLLPKQTDNICEYADSILDAWLRQPSLSTDPGNSIPPFIGYLGVFVYVATIEEGSERSYHRNLWTHFPISSWKTTPTMYPGFERMRRLWDALEVWSHTTQRGARGRFQLLKLGSFRHVSIPWAQAIMTEEERLRLPGLFTGSELTPQSPAPPDRLRQIVSEFGKTTLNARTRRAVAEGGELADYVLDDLRRELRAWDGTWRPQDLMKGSAINVPPRSADLVVFLWPRGVQLLARLRFESAIDEELAPVRYLGRDGRPTVVAAPKPGWSDMVRAADGTEFDAALIDWERDHAWEGKVAGGPRRLKFAGRNIRVFLQASAYGLGGLVEGDRLPATGRCWVAAGPKGRDEFKRWLDLFKSNTYRLKIAGLPNGWGFYEIDAVPADLELRSQFPGGIDDLEPELRLRGGLRLRRGGANEYYTFSPPRIELAGNRDGVTVYIGEAPLVPVDDLGLGGLYELPLTAESGYIQVRAVRAGNLVAEEAFTLVDVAHAGGPTRIRGLLDGFGRATTNPVGWCGAWVEAPGLLPFDFCSLSPPSPTDPTPFKNGAEITPEVSESVSPESLPPIETNHMEPLKEPTSWSQEDVSPNPSVPESPAISVDRAAQALNALALHSSVVERLSDVRMLSNSIVADLAQRFSSSPDSKKDLTAVVREFLDKIESVREDARQICSVADLTPEWSDRDALSRVLEVARTCLEAKLISLAAIPVGRLAEQLDAGQVTHHLPKTRVRLNALRQEAASELRSIANPRERPLPGPPGCEDWLDWFWATGDDAEQIVDEIRLLSPSLADFLESVIREQWKKGGAETRPAAEMPLPVGPATSHPVKVETTASDVDPKTDELLSASESLPLNDNHAPDSAPETGGVSEETSQCEVARPANVETQIGPSDTDFDQSSIPGNAAGADDGQNHAEISPTPIASRPRETAYTPQIKLPFDLASFDNFKKSHWITPHGACKTAPWTASTSFGQDVTFSLFRALEGEQFGRAKVFAEAAGQLGCDGAPSADEIETWSRLWMNPRDAIGLGVDGVLELRLAAAEGRLGPGQVWKLRICLEAVRPSRDLPLIHGEEDEWIEAVDFRAATLQQFLLLLMSIGRTTDRPTDDFLRVLNASGMRLEALTDALAEARKNFYTEMRRLWSGAGGKIERNHCRRAWDEFVSQIRSTVEALYPTSERGRDQWDAADVGRKIARFEKTHKEIADKWKAMFHDRLKMDRAARTIAELAAGINELYVRIQSAKSGEAARLVPDEQMVIRACALMAEPPLDDSFEECCRQLLVRHIDPKITVHSFTGFTQAELLSYPALLGCLAIDPEVLSELKEGDIVPVGDINAPLAAAAVLLEQPHPVSPALPDESFVDRLASTLLPRERYDVLGPLARLLSASHQAKIRAAQNAMAVETAEAFGRVNRGWEQLADMASREERVLKSLLNDAGKRMNSVTADPSAKPSEELLFKDWLQRLAVYTDELLAHELDSLRRALSDSPDLADSNILLALNEQRFADAIFLRHEGARDQSVRPIARRQTAWRRDATSRPINPKKELREYRRGLDSSGRGKSELRDLIDTWLDEHSGSPKSDSPLRTRFADVVFADTFGGEGEQLRKQGKSESSYFRIPCQKVREYLARQGLNPSFLPQLAKAEDLVLITPPAKFSDPGLVQQTANLIAANHARKLVAVLAPAISKDLRAALLHELRQRKFTAAVVDSTDLCRLLNPSGRQISLVVGLLEVMLEQQRWTISSPFHAHDGAQSPIEMYVGRAEEAEILATDNKYSRLFSGRKLGKSALLKFIEDKYQGYTLPSGNLLRVLRIPIVGNDADAVIIGKVLSELKSRLEFRPAIPADLTADSFLGALTEFLASRPKDSLLVILDEADVFIESQLRDFDRRKEQCLSFRIRSDAQKEIDGQGLPRIRFVFAGYRKANTRGGAWGNWGDPLLLNPLEADEAADLIAGPLARLGIDAAAVAPSIAYRCGYQPAVILRFGERLLDLLDAHYPDMSDRDYVLVSPSDVREVFDQQAVQDEIRTVVRNNFHGNDAGQAVFAATLLAFGALAPGDALVNAPVEIWRQLRTLVDKADDSVREATGRIGWLNSRSPEVDEPTEVALGEVNRHLADFHERKLLTLVNREDGMYRLRFPYHLSTLLVGVELEAWTALGRLARATGPTGDEDVVGDPIDPLALNDLDMVLRKHKELGLGEYRAGVLGTLWPDPVSDKNWLSNRLGYEPDQLSQTGPRQMNAQAYLELSAEEADAVLRGRPEGAPPVFIVGGADILRWGHRQLRLGQAVEVHGQRRMSRSAIERWFRRVRGFEFDRDELGRIAALTGRIPYLLNLFDLVLQLTVGTDGGVNVSQEQFEVAVDKYDKRLPDFIEKLISGSEVTRLEKRERELLLMTVIVARSDSFQSASLYKEIQEYWDEKLYDDDWQKATHGQPYPNAFADTPEDRLSARVIADLGLLPHPLDYVCPRGEAFIQRDDPLVVVVAPMLIRLSRPSETRQTID